MGAVRRELRWLSWGGDWSFRLASRSVMLGWGGGHSEKLGAATGTGSGGERTGCVMSPMPAAERSGRVQLTATPNKKKLGWWISKDGKQTGIPSGFRAFGPGRGRCCFGRRGPGPRGSANKDVALIVGGWLRSS